MSTKHREQALTVENSGDKDWDNPDMLWIPPAFVTRMTSQGYHTAWLRYTEGDDRVDRRLSQRLHQGWEFVRPESIPEWRFPPTLEHVKLSNLVAVGDVALAIIPIENFRRYKGLEELRAKQQTEAIRNQLMSQSDRKMPIADNSRESVTQGGRPTKFGD